MLARSLLILLWRNLHLIGSSAQRSRFFLTSWLEKWRRVNYSSYPMSSKFFLEAFPIRKSSLRQKDGAAQMILMTRLLTFVGRRFTMREFLWDEFCQRETISPGGWKEDFNWIPRRGGYIRSYWRWKPFVSISVGYCNSCQWYGIRQEIQIICIYPVNLNIL